MSNKALAAERAENHERIDHALEIMGSLARTLENVIYGMAIQELIQTMDMENVAPLAGSTICDGSTGAEPAKHLGKKKWKNIMQQHIISWSQSRVVADCTQTTYQVGCTCK